MIDNIYACEAGEHLGVQGLRFSKPVPVILKSLQIVFVLDHSLSVVLKIVTIAAEHFLHFSFKKNIKTCFTTVRLSMQCFWTWSMSSWHNIIFMRVCRDP